MTAALSRNYPSFCKMLITYPLASYISPFGFCPKESLVIGITYNTLSSSFEHIYRSYIPTSAKLSKVPFHATLAKVTAIALIVLMGYGLKVYDTFTSSLKNVVPIIALTPIVQAACLGIHEYFWLESMKKIQEIADQIIFSQNQ